MNEAEIEGDPDFPLKLETFKIIGACMEVHNHLGKGFLEVVYQDALEHELGLRRIKCSREVPFTVNYKGVTLPHQFYADFVVSDEIILETKAVTALHFAHEAQLLNYLHVSRKQVGLLINFGQDRLQMKRIIL